MVDPTTTNLKLAVPTHGSDVDTWDVPLNANAGIIDAALGSVTSKALTNVNVTLTETEAQASILRFSGALSGNVTVNVGAIIKSWYIDNLTTGSFVLTIYGGSGNVVGVPAGETTQVYWDGTNCKFINLGRVGSYLDLATSTVPAWISACTIPPYLYCNGGAFSAVTYPALNAFLGGTTLPDSRGRARFAFNAGTGRLTTPGGINGDSLLAGGGTGTGLVITTPNLPGYTPSGVADVVITNQGRAGQLSTANVASGAGAVAIVPGNGIFLNNSDIAAGATFTGNAQGGTSTPMASAPPGYVGGITLIRAA